ncbi:MAG: hypothetical protein WBL22_16850, partial [Candidatus Sulfotelmatobacter sp.]
RRPDCRSRSVLFHPAILGAGGACKLDKESGHCAFQMPYNSSYTFNEGFSVSSIRLAGDGM